MIPVTKPFLPPQREYDAYIHQIFERNWLTNNGPLLNELEIKLKRYLGLRHLLLVSNGTIAIQLAIRALGLGGEIITTPFSYIATTSATVWEGCVPVFVDIEEATLHLDPEKIEEAITPRTSAILATHVYGHACNIEAILEIAARRGLKVIYDAAHCFGSLYHDQSILSYGDISTCSFHATKLFHMTEGGCVTSPDPDLMHRISKMRNFGHHGEYEFEGVGINAKCSEFHAAMGLCNLRYIEAILDKRKALTRIYDQKLEALRVRKPELRDGEQWNFAYYPIIFESEPDLQAARNALSCENIGTRRYFYPLLSGLDYVGKTTALSVAESIVSRVLCLPLYHTLSEEEAKLIARILIETQKD